MKELNINELYSLILECRNYLKSTDYQVLREFEEGVPIEKKVKTRRSRARARINEAQKLIKELEDEKKK